MPQGKPVALTEALDKMTHYYVVNPSEIGKTTPIIVTGHSFWAVLMTSGRYKKVKDTVTRCSQYSMVYKKKKSPLYSRYKQALKLEGPNER